MLIVSIFGVHIDSDKSKSAAGGRSVGEKVTTEGRSCWVFISEKKYFVLFTPLYFFRVIL